MISFTQTLSLFAFGFLGWAGVAVAAPAGLVHHWNFDEGPDWHDSAFQSVYAGTLARDSAGTADATLQNMGAASWVSGRQFTGLAFDGVDDSLTVAGDLAATLGGSATLSLWLRTTQVGTASSATAPGITGLAGANRVQWAWLDDAGRVALSVDDALVVRSATAVNDGQWHHVLITRNAMSGAGQLYIDGVLSASGTGAAGVRSASFAALGKITAYFAGRMDQVTIFNRVVTAGEVSTLRANHAPKVWSQSSDGVNDRAFSTPSVFSRAYDVERDVLTVSRWSTPANGTVTHNGNGSFNYTATGGYTGMDAFEVTVEDGQGGYDRMTMTLKIIAEPPGGTHTPVTTFTNYAALQAAGVDMSHSGWRVPRVLDWDGDGRKDLLIGAGGYVWRYMNTGTAAAPSFAAGVKVQAAGVDIYAGNTSSSPIALADITGDGVPDLVMTDSASKLRVYRNTSAAGAAPVYVAAVFIKMLNGATDFVSPDRRFDIGDWNGDGRPDLVTGASGNVQLFLNINTAASARFETSSVLFDESYNAYPRFCDLGMNGQLDMIRGINWGNIKYWLNVRANGLAGAQHLTIKDSAGATVTAATIKTATDGVIADFADLNGDGRTDIIMGGHAADKVFIAYGTSKRAADSIAEIEAIYDANPVNLGTALSANSDELLGKVNAANTNLVSILQSGSLGTREALSAALIAHINKYAFLKYQQLDTAIYHHVPSIVLQNWVMLRYLLPDTPARRVVVADAMGLTGDARQIFLEAGLALGDNAKSVPAAYGTVRDMMRRHPREAFPDAILTFDQLYGDQRGGFIWSPNSSKNTFGQNALGNANEWATDLTGAIEKVIGAGSASGDYFTFVMGHEVCHSLDNYVNTRANTDLRRRWGQRMVYAAGPDVVAKADGWFDLAATQTAFQTKGLYNPATQTWTQAWDSYWAFGPGAAFNSLASMRIDIKFFLEAPQESLATQANHHFANGPGRIIGALDRFRRAKAAGNEPMKANMTEVVDFIDFISCGMNRVNLVETKNQAGVVVYFDHYAELVRDDKGRIIRITLDGEVHDFNVDATGIIRDVTSTVAVVSADNAPALSGHGQALRVAGNDLRYDGSPLVISSFTQPARGSIIDSGGGVLIYRSTPGYTGSDSFTYQSAGKTATVTLNVVSSSNGVLQETWQNMSGTTLTNLTGNSRFPSSPDDIALITTFESPVNRGTNFGARARAWVTPSVSGNYTFWIASDDDGELWMSTNASPTNKSLIANVSGFTTSRQWSKYPSQQSAVRSLVAGQRYYIEALHKEATGGDNLAVAWSGPGIAQQVIGSAFLTAYQLNHDPTIVADSATTSFNTGISIPVLANDSDVDADTLIIRSITQPANGSATINGTSINYTPTLNYSGSDTLTYTANDQQGGIVTSTINVAVTITPLQSWQRDSFGPNITNPAIAGDNADSDRDGIVNLMEYATATNPVASDPAPQSATKSASTIEVTRP
ncbi:MAG: tandem-95 repeat protein [Verrucomicrobia bacterium]|nr:tandem-95 repeat protein [Verrucomicrobiota bacterium]